MKVIENKKLFGKINLIDILIVIVILIVGIIAYKVIFKSETAVNIGAKYFTTTYMLKLEGLPKDANEYLEIGADVYDNETNVYIGKLKDFSVDDYKLVKTNFETNEFVEAVVPNGENIYVTIEVAVSDQGADLITSNNYYIKVGKHINMRCKNLAGGGYITFVDREEK